MPNKDIRWIQRFSNYRKALTKLTEAVDIFPDAMTDLEIEGLIQRFEYTFELAWKTLQDFVIEKGFAGERGKPKAIIIDAAERGLVDKQSWILMLEARNDTSHTYDEEKANEIAEKIAETYHDLFVQLETRLQLEKIEREKEK